MEKDTKMSLEERLLLPQKRSNEGREGKAQTWQEFTREAKRLAYIAGPMIVTTTTLNLLLVISNMMVGHLGELALSSSAIAISLCNVTGISPLNGMASALETLCGQAYGAQQYRKVGNQTYGAMFSLVLVALVVSLVWINMEKLLIVIGQDPIIAHEAGKFTLWLIPAIFAYAIFQPLSRYLQVQSITIPMLVSSCVTLLLHIPLCWFLVFKSGLRNLGGALAVGISYWLNAIFLILYVKYSSACAKTRVPISIELFHGIGEFFRYAIPSAIMICLQWWSYEIVILLSGLLSNPQLETSVLSLCLTTIGTLYSIPYGLSAAVRCCKGMWLAAYRGLRQSCSIVSMRGSSCCDTRPLVAAESKGSLDWHTSRCHFANSSAVYCNKLYELGKTGKSGKGKDI